MGAPNQKVRSKGFFTRVREISEAHGTDGQKSHVESIRIVGDGLVRGIHTDEGETNPQDESEERLHHHHMDAERFLL